ncbi:MAG TPA: sensor histidine kinase, partial [Gammaproteobacteria bacterium]
MLPIFAQRLTPPDKTPALDLKRVFVLRNIALSTVVIIVFLTHYVLKLELPLTPLLIVMALLGCLNIYTYVCLERSPQISALEFFTQLVVDVIFLTALLYYTGGSTNPFVSLFLLPLVIIATALPHVYTWAMAALSITCYTLLMFFYIPLPHINTGHFTNSDLHTFGM